MTDAADRLPPPWLPPPWHADGGESGALVRALDWLKTPLGAIDAWPVSLRVTVGTLLHSRHPMFLWWGPELVQIYNDAYVPSFGQGKHPSAMGQRGEECWQEIWPIIFPQIDAVMRHGKASWNEDHLVPVWRNERIEEVYWTYGYSPVFAESGDVQGTLVVCTETTPRVLGERRRKVDRAMAAIDAASPSLVIDAASAILEASPYDVSFALFYLADGPTNEPTLARTIGLAEAESRLLGDACRSRLASLAQTRDAVRLETIAPLRLFGPTWPEPVTSLFVAPLGSDVRGSRGFIVFGASPRLAFDEAYRDHLSGIAGSVDIALARIQNDLATRRAEADRAHLLAQEQLARKEADTARAELHSLFMQAPAAICVLRGPSHRFELANPLYRRLVGRDVVGHTVRDALPEVVEQGFIAILDRVYGTGETFYGDAVPIAIESPSGATTKLILNFVYEPFRDTRGSVAGILVIAFDVTEAAKARAHAEASERLLREIVDNLPELAWNARPDGHVDFYNRRWYEYTGTTFDEMEGWGWKAVHAPERLAEVIERWRGSLATGEAFEMEFPLRGADGVFRWFLTRALPLRNAEGHIVRWLGTNTNIDERIRTDAFKELFLGILGHDLRNPLSSILTTVRLMAMRDETPPGQQKHLARIVSSGVRMQRMIEQLLDMTRARLAGGIAITRSETDVDIGALVLKVIDEIGSTIPGRSLAFEMSEPSFARVDPDRFEQVVSNLLGNAVTYGASGKPISITLTEDPHFIRLSVHNQGTPISPDFLPLIFNPFAQSTRTGRSTGLGLGLYISERIVAAHGGRVDVASSAEEGTRFEVVIPKST